MTKTRGASDSRFHARFPISSTGAPSFCSLSVQLLRAAQGPRSERGLTLLSLSAMGVVEASSSVLIFVCAALLHFALLPCLATDHLVGANRGWQPPPNVGPDVHLNYTVWAEAQNFYLGDEISFRYPENMQYTVFQVNFSVYTNCTINMWSGHDWIYNWTNKGGRTVVPLNKTMIYYFVDATHCNEGMKVFANVTKNETQPTNLAKVSSTPTPKESSHASIATNTMTLATLLLLQGFLFMCMHILYPTM